MIQHSILRLIFLLAVACNIACVNAGAQAVIPFKYSSEDENKLLKENDSVRFYAATGDTTNAVTINEETLYYKLVNKRSKKKVVAEGSIVADGDHYLQQGKWMQYHSNGQLYLSGSFHRGKPIGQWEEHYTDGRLKIAYHFAIITDKDGMNTCMSGEYTEYYPDGKPKVSGFYTADRTRKTDSIVVEDPVSGQQLSKTVSRSVYTARKAGFWDYYSETGEVEKHEEF